MVALKVGKLPPGEELQRAYRDAWPEQDQLEPSGDGTASKIALATAQASFGVELAPAPIPWADLEPAIRAALHWPEAEESLKPHVAHLVVTAQSDEQDAVDLMLSLTRMVAACLLTSEAAGVFWGGGSLVNSAEAFLDDAGEMSREYLPLYLWVRFGLMRDKDKTVTLYTLGLDQLDLHAPDTEAGLAGEGLGWHPDPSSDVQIEVWVPSQRRALERLCVHVAPELSYPADTFGALEDAILLDEVLAKARGGPDLGTFVEPSAGAADVIDVTVGEDERSRRPWRQLRELRPGLLGALGAHHRIHHHVAVRGVEHDRVGEIVANRHE